MALCWAHALDNQPAQALPHRDQVVARGVSPFAYDGRALARAEQGDPAGAAQDIQAFLTWLRDQEFAGRDTLQTTRTEWLRALQAGQNPYDDAVRARLRQE